MFEDSLFWFVYIEPEDLNVPQFIDDSQLEYFGTNWSQSTNQLIGPTEGSNCNCSYSQSITDSVVFTFTNTTKFEFCFQKIFM